MTFSLPVFETGVYIGISEQISICIIYKGFTQQDLISNSIAANMLWCAYYSDDIGEATL